MSNFWGPFETNMDENLMHVYVNIYGGNAALYDKN